jgi:hypothetical protein
MTQSSRTRLTNGIAAFQTNDPKATSDDPFAAQRGEGEDPFAKDKLGDVAGADDMAPPDDGAAAVEDDSKDFGRRMSREWGKSRSLRLSQS